MRYFFYIFILVKIYSSSLFAVANFRIVPFNLQNHRELFGSCFLQHFSELCSSDQCFKMDSLCGYNQSKLLDISTLKYQHGEQYAQNLAKFCNRFGKIFNNDGSITRVSVLELEKKPVGYSIDSMFFPSRAFGTIHQFVILNEYQRKGLGRELIINILKRFTREKDIANALLVTKNKQYAEPFLSEQFNFVKYTDEKENSKRADNYYWFLGLK